MSVEDSFASWWDRLLAGEADAATEVFERFAARLIAVARTHFDARIAHRVDPEDVVQSAYKSFFVRHREGKLHAGDWGSLWNLLTLITLRKCADKANYLRARRRDVMREARAPATEDAPLPWENALDREPSPEEASVLTETVEDLFHGLDDSERPILELSLQGYTAPEIAVQLGRAERSVRRLRERIRKRLERMREGG